MLNHKQCHERCLTSSPSEDGGSGEEVPKALQIWRPFSSGTCRGSGGATGWLDISKDPQHPGDVPRITVKIIKSVHVDGGFWFMLVNHVVEYHIWPRMMMSPVIHDVDHEA